MLSLKNLFNWRAFKNLTQKELSEKSGVTTYTIGRAEAGDAVNVKTANALAAALEISLADLLNKDPLAS